MRFELDIDYPVEKMEATARRWEARQKFAYYDRVPVLFCAVPRFFAPIFGIEYKEFFKDAATQYYWQLQFAKFRFENIPEDYCTEPAMYVSPYFDNVMNASALGAEIGWSDNETPRAISTIKNVDMVDSFEIAKPDSGLWGTMLNWREEMKGFARDTRITFRGEPGEVRVGPPVVSGEGPHMLAVDLVGEDFYWWMAEYPETCHKLLDKITRSLMGTQEFYDRMEPWHRGEYGLAEDAAQIMSAEMFRKFCIPYDTALYERFGAGLPNGRGMHMCGDSTHLHESLRDDLKVTAFNMFGYLVPPQVAAKNLGGRMLLVGNVNPMLMLTGSNYEVKAEAMACLEALAPCGGFVLSDGANVCPGTPLENLAVFTEAVEEYGMPETCDG